MNVVPLQTKETDMQIEFSDFWGMYPRRVAKKDARKAWEKIPPTMHNKILTSLFEWRRIWTDRGEIEYVPYPASWLNGERWEDEYPPHHRPYTARQQAAEQQQSKTEEKDRKHMPAHIRDALNKIRGQS